MTATSQVIGGGGKVRVLHVIDSFDLGGGQTALLNLIRSTDRTKYEPEVACMHGHGVFWDDFEKLGVPVHSLSPHKYLPVYLTRLAGIILARKPQIVHCHLFGSNWLAKPLAALLRVPVLVCHDQCNDAVRYERPLLRWVDTLTNRLSSHVCAVSASTRDFLIKHERMAPGNISLVYNGVDLTQFRAPDVKPRLERFVVLGVGRLHPQKNFSLFIDVAAELAKRRIRAEFRLAGTGPEEAVLRAKVAALGIEDRVHFLGHVRDTAQLYASADVLLMTSRFEGTPLTILEAMAMRLPIVAPHLDGIGEILQTNEDALLIEPPECGQFADALVRLIDEPELGVRLAQSAEKIVQTRFSSEAMASQVETIYEQCLKPKHS